MHIFNELDADGSNTISLDEWLHFSGKQEAMAVMNLIGLDASRTKDIWKLLDLDGTNELDLQEFCVGCMQLCGAAKMVDVETLMRNNGKLMRRCTERFDEIQEHIEACLEKQVERMNVNMSKIERLVYLIPGANGKNGECGQFML